MNIPQRFSSLMWILTREVPRSNSKIRKITSSSSGNIDIEVTRTIYATPFMDFHSLPLLTRLIEKSSDLLSSPLMMACPTSFKRSLKSSIRSRIVSRLDKRGIESPHTWFTLCRPSHISKPPPDAKRLVISCSLSIDSCLLHET